MMLLAQGEMIRNIYKIFVRPDWVQFFFLFSLLCGLYTCIYVANKILLLYDTLFYLNNEGQKDILWFVFVAITPKTHKWML